MEKPIWILQLVSWASDVDLLKDEVTVLFPCCWILSSLSSGSSIAALAWKDSCGSIYCCLFIWTQICMLRRLFSQPYVFFSSKLRRVALLDIWPEQTKKKSRVHTESSAATASSSTTITADALATSVEATENYPVMDSEVPVTICSILGMVASISTSPGSLSAAGHTTLYKNSNII